MNKTISITVTLVVLILGYYLYTSNSDNMMSKDKDLVMSPAPSVTDQQMTKDDKKMEESPDSAMMKKSSRYLPFEDGILEANSSLRRILFFYASWCPTCRPVDAELTKRVAEIPEGVIVIRVNYNDPETDSAEKDLAKKYGVTYQHTFVEISSDGEKVQSWNGGSVDMLLDKLN